MDSLLEFCEDVFLFVGFKIAGFDSVFLPFLKENPEIRLFDLMTENRDILRVGWVENRNEWKLPSTQETARAYGFDFGATRPHPPMQYVKLFARIFDEMRYKAHVRLPRIEAQPELS